MQCHIVATAIYAIGWQFQLRGISLAKHLLAQESSALNNRDHSSEKYSASCSYIDSDLKHNSFLMCINK